MEKKEKSGKKKKKTTYIGGQAVIEGVMMRGKTAVATAVRDPDGNIQIEAKRVKPYDQRSKFSRLPFVRGVFSFWDSLVGGSKILMRSAEVFGSEGEPSSTEKWIAEKLHVSVSTVLSGVSMVIGVLLAIGLFFFLPVVVTGFFAARYPEIFPVGGILYNLIAGVVRIIVFIAYIAFTSIMKDMRRTYMYHGAEHKTISCYEYGMPLTVENVKKCTRVHDRCGTTFMFLVMVVSILIFAVVTWLVKLIPVFGEFFETATATTLHKVGANLLMFVIHIIFLPLVAGTSYEILRLLAKSQAKILLIFKAPGLALQRLTTREPKDDMIECAIAAFNRVLVMDEDPSYPESSFILIEKLSDVLARLKKTFRENHIEEEEAEWICSIVLDMPKSSLSGNTLVTREKNLKIDKIVTERLSGRPLWYIIGDTSFCGYPIKVDERVLIPRPETEELVELVGKEMKPNYKKILDLCTGSGAIAIALNKRLPQNTLISFTASDISEEALALAKENAQENGAGDIKFIRSDLFGSIKGKFHVIVCNPPYIKTSDLPDLQREIKDHEPRIALDGGKDGLDFYRRIAEQAPSHLYKGGVLYMECGMGQAEKIIKMFPDCDYSLIIRDMNGIERFVKVVI